MTLPCMYVERERERERERDYISESYMIGKILQKCFGIASVKTLHVRIFYSVL